MLKARAGAWDKGESDPFLRLRASAGEEEVADCLTDGAKMGTWLDGGKLAEQLEGEPGNLKLESPSRVAVIGGGPAGSFFSYFLLEMAERVDLEIQVDIYEPRDFSLPGPGGCNMCGGIVSESLVQALAAEGIRLPPTVVQRGIDSYVLHTDVASVRIETPLREKRIASVYRGAGPRGTNPKGVKWRSFDGYLQELAAGKGAHVVRARVESVGWEGGRPQVKTQGGLPQPYDLVAAAVGVNTATRKLFEGLGLGYKPPLTSKTYICEFFVGQEEVERYLSSSMHVFLLNIPRLEFAALIPKGEYATLCLLGQEIDKQLVQSFLQAPEVKNCLPAGWQASADFCHCSPRISVQSAVQPFADRVVFIGDCGATKLYKDGIGSAYRTAKAAAVTAIFAGIAAQDFRRRYWPACQSICADNRIGKFVFAVTRQIQRRRFLRRGLSRMVSREQQKGGDCQRMSTVLWDTFTGSAPYRDVLVRTLHPSFLGRFLWEIAAGFWPSNQASR